MFIFMLVGSLGDVEKMESVGAFKSAFLPESAVYLPLSSQNPHVLTCTYRFIAISNCYWDSVPGIEVIMRARPVRCFAGVAEACRVEKNAE